MAHILALPGPQLPCVKTKKMRLDRSEESSALDVTKIQRKVSKGAGREGQGLLSREADPTEKCRTSGSWGWPLMPLVVYPLQQPEMAWLTSGRCPCPAWLRHRKVSLQVTEPITGWTREGPNRAGCPSPLPSIETSPRRSCATRARSPGKRQPAWDPGPLALVSAPHIHRDGPLPQITRGCTCF